MEKELSSDSSKHWSRSLSKLKVDTLPYRLFLVSVQRDSLDSCIKPLLHLSFYSDMRSTFFSYTDTDEEISLILDEESVRYFKSAVGSNVSFTVAPDGWKAIQVDEEATMIDATGIIANLSAPLTDAGIGMIYLSAYECDLILVQESQIDEAVSCLFNKIFVKEPKAAQDEISKRKIPSTKILATTLSARLALATLKTSAELTSCTHALLRQLFFSKSETRFFSFLSPTSKSSFILEHNCLDTFPRDSLIVHRDCWRAILVSGEVSSSPTVNVFSSVLASANVSIYYLSTYNADFILVPERSLEDAIQCLQNKLNVVFSE